VAKIYKCVSLRAAFADPSRDNAALRAWADRKYGAGPVATAANPVQPVQPTAAWQAALAAPKSDFVLGAEQDKARQNRRPGGKIKPRARWSKDEQLFFRGHPVPWEKLV